MIEQIAKGRKMREGKYYPWRLYDEDWKKESKRGNFLVGLIISVIVGVAICLLFVIAADVAGAVTIEDAVYFEGRNQPFAGQVAIALVILERAERQGKTVEEVITAPYQFSFYWDGKSDVPTNKEALEMARFAVLVAYNLKALNIKFNATHYHARYVHPAWADELSLVAVIGDHIFYE